MVRCERSLIHPSYVFDRRLRDVIDLSLSTMNGFKSDAVSEKSIRNTSHFRSRNDLLLGFTGNIQSSPA